MLMPVDQSPVRKTSEVRLKPRRQILAWLALATMLVVCPASGAVQDEYILRCSPTTMPRRTAPPEYVAWSDTNAPEADRREASALLAELVGKDHPRHKAVYSGMTLEELRQRVGRKASPAGLLI